MRTLDDEKEGLRVWDHCLRRRTEGGGGHVTPVVNPSAGKVGSVDETATDFT